MSARCSRRRALLRIASAAACIGTHPDALATAGTEGARARPGPLTPVLGNPAGARVLAVYFDYHCPYCREMDPLLPTLAERNPDLRILFKEFPILRWDSETAARIALSAQLRGRYFEVHQRLMHSSGDFTGAVATDIARWLDVDPTPFREDMGSLQVSAELQQNSAEARDMRIRATPAVVSRLAIVQGSRNLHELQAMVDATRG